MMVDRIKEAIIWPSKDSFKNWAGYLKLGIPVTVMLWSEQFAFDILTLLSGLISVQAQATMIILGQLNG